MVAGVILVTFVSLSMQAANGVSLDQTLMEEQQTFTLAIQLI